MNDHLQCGGMRHPARSRGSSHGLLAALVPLLLAIGSCDDGKKDSSDSVDQTAAGTAGDTGALNYVAIGDSITAGSETPGTSYPQVLSGMLGKTVVNAGVGGEKTSGGLGRIGGLASRYRPACVLIMEGMNDVRKLNLDLNTSVANLREMVRIVKANGGTPILATVTPNLVSTEHIARMAQLNQGIRGVASSEGVRLVDMDAAFNNNPQLLLPDLIHPNDAGTRLMAQKFYAAVR